MRRRVIPLVLILIATTMSTGCGGGDEDNGLSYAWDAFYNYGLQWRCRDKNTGQFLDNSTCGQLPMIDNTWPSSPPISPGGWYYGVRVDVMCAKPMADEIAKRGRPISNEGFYHHGLFTQYPQYSENLSRQPYWREVNTGYNMYTWKYADKTVITWYMYRGDDAVGPYSGGRVRCLKVTVSNNVVTREEFFTDY